MLNTWKCWESGHTRELRASSPGPGSTYLPSGSLIISFCNKLGYSKQTVFLSSVSWSSKLSNPRRGSWEHSDLVAGWSAVWGACTCDRCLKWGVCTKCRWCQNRPGLEDTQLIWGKDNPTHPVAEVLSRNSSACPWPYVFVIS